MIISTGILFGIITMILFGLSNALARVPNRAIGGERTVFFRNFFTSIILCFLVFVFIDKTNFSWYYVGVAFLISIIGYIPLLLFYKSVSVGDVTVVAPIAQSSVIISSILALVFYGQSLGLREIIAIILVVLGISLLSINFRDFRKISREKIARGVPYALGACFLWGFVFFSFRIPVVHIGPYLTTFIIEFGILIVAGIHMKIKGLSFSRPNNRLLLIIFLNALIIAGATLFYNLGVSSYSVAFIGAFSAASPLVSSLYAFMFYDEKLSFAKVFGVIIIVLGLVIISL